MAKLSFDSPDGGYSGGSKLAVGEHTAIITEFNYNDEGGKSGFPYCRSVFDVNGKEVYSIFSFSPRALVFLARLFKACNLEPYFEIEHDFEGQSLPDYINYMVEKIKLEKNESDKNKLKTELEYMFLKLYKFVKKSVLGRKVNIVLKLGEPTVSKEGYPYTPMIIDKILPCPNRTSATEATQEQKPYDKTAFRSLDEEIQEEDDNSPYPF